PESLLALTRSEALASVQPSKRFADNRDENGNSQGAGERGLKAGWGALAATSLGTGVLAAPAVAQEPIVIGVSTAQTGPAAVAAEWELWGVNLALEEINANGGVLGRKLEILVMDNKCNPSEAVNVANKLVEAKVVAIEGAHCSSGHLASMKIIQDARIPMITGIASNPQITTLSGKGGNEYAFRISASDAGMMQALGIYLADKKPFKTVAIVA